MWLFYLFAALLLCQSLLSLRGGFRYLRFFRRELRRAPANFTPRASVIVPCRGVDQDLRENLAALFRQDYTSYELIFVADSADDPALQIVEAARRDHPHIPSRVVVAGRARDCGQKVHNLRAAVSVCDAACAVLVFVDTDARPREHWLRTLVAPLADESVGAATGYRWFMPARARLASTLRAVWNASIASALGADTRRNFCWGGSTAIRRATFDRLNILNEWRGALSDDYALTRALQRAQLPIKFVPACLVVSREDCSWRALFEFTTRQLKITRVYAPRLWQIVLISNLVFCAVFYSGILIIAARVLRGASFALPLALVASIFALGACKAHLRLRAVNLIIAREGAHVRGIARLAHLSLWTLTSALFLYNALAASISRRITWRGISYELKSPTETLVLKQATREETF
jgi:ceramide glucosyltransferase